MTIEEGLKEAIKDRRGCRRELVIAQLTQDIPNNKLERYLDVIRKFIEGLN